LSDAGLALVAGSTGPSEQPAIAIEAKVIIKPVVLRCFMSMLSPGLGALTAFDCLLILNLSRGAQLVLNFCSALHQALLNADKSLRFILETTQRRDHYGIRKSFSGRCVRSRAVAREMNLRLR
jgi:hypothetical protein